MKCSFQNQITFYHAPFADQKVRLKNPECVLLHSQIWLSLEVLQGFTSQCHQQIESEKDPLPNQSRVCPEVRFLELKRPAPLQSMQDKETLSICGLTSAQSPEVWRKADSLQVLDEERISAFTSEEEVLGKFSHLSNIEGPERN